MDFEHTAGAPDRFESVASALAARVQAIVQTAEREAAAVQVDLEEQRREAESETERYLTEARQRADAAARERLEQVRALADGLVARAEQARQQLDALVAALEQADAELGVPRGETSGTAAAGPASVPSAPPVTAEPIVPPADEPLPAEEPLPLRPVSPAPPTHAAEDEETVDAGRLRAIQMAVAGSTRAEVELYLRARHEPADVGAILDDVFGKGSEDESRMSWGAG